MLGLAPKNIDNLTKYLTKNFAQKKVEVVPGGDKNIEMLTSFRFNNKTKIKLN